MIKVLFAFFSISLLLLSGTIVMSSYAQPSQGKQLLPQQQQQQQQSVPQLDTDNTPLVFESDVPFSESDERALAAQTSTANQTANQTFRAQAVIQSPQPRATLTAPPSAQLVPDTGAIARGCKQGLYDRDNPAWVSVSPFDYPVVVEGTVTTSKVSHTDHPFNHHSHDHNFDVKLDPLYTGYAGTANPVKDGQRVMEMEWEIGTDNSGKTDRFPKEFWPMEGDRVWMKGRWIYDCSHYSVDTSVRPFRYYGFQTEVHPVSAVAFMRNEPYKFPGDNKPSSAVKTYVYIHGHGGYYYAPVGGRNYEFDIPMPPKPSDPRTTQLRYHVIGLPFGGPAPILTPKPQENKVHVVIPLSGVPSSTGLKYGAIVAAKWTSLNTINPLPEPGFRTLRVTFYNMKVNEDHDPFASGEWNNLWVGVNGKWIELSGPSGRYGLNDVDNGEVIVFPTGYPNPRKEVTLIVPESGTLKIRTTGWESDGADGYFGKRFASIRPPTLDNNDRIGTLKKDFTAANNFGIGSRADFSDRNGDSDTYHDFNLRYRIEQLSVTPPTTQPPVAQPPPAPPVKPPTTPTPPEQQLPPICKTRPWLPQCKELT